MVYLCVFSYFLQSRAPVPHYINFLVKIGSSRILSTLSPQRCHSPNPLFPPCFLFFLKWICCCYCVWDRVLYLPSWARTFYVAEDGQELLNLLPHFLSAGISGMQVPMEAIVSCQTWMLGTNHVLHDLLLLLLLLFFVSVKFPNVQGPRKASLFTWVENICLILI